ncbi:putative NRPS-like protein biosynthetic cluster [Purpureocillium lilacinum]|uniref:putative NRPS-like protein biosynthetic cluster n=1 Tax=Purpureocillium lilacinum TaxID=33203 RepID=UPI00208C8BF1|nr:putative NRPS-like protein biosynthetic cluster [Purpureocillium lilacinum]
MPTERITHHFFKEPLGNGKVYTSHKMLLMSPECDPTQDLDDNQVLQTDFYPVVLEMNVGTDKITAAARFNPKRMEPQQTLQLLERLELVMYQLGDANSELKLADIVLYTPTELETIWTWNKTVPIPITRCVHHMVEEMVQAQPDAPAVYAWDGVLTYRELSQLATKLACQLVEAGVGKDVLVPLCFEKSMWAPVAMMGVLKAGSGFVLLDPTLPDKRLRTMLEQTDSGILLSSVASAGLSSQLARRVIQVGPNLSAAPYHTFHQGSDEQQSSAPMFAVFTSGSSGTPKGVVLTHENFCSSLKYQLELFGFTSGSRVFDFASYAFDIAVHNAFATFVSGGCLCIPSENDRKENLIEVMADMRATMVDVTPTIAGLLDPTALPDLKTIILAGEPVSAKDVERWWGKAHVINAYGPAECHISVLNAAAMCPEDATRIGTGAGLVTWVVNPDDHDELLPPGFIGELLLEGPLVGRGYLNDMAKTAAAFINDPQWLLRGSVYHPGRRGRLYKTGDLVKIRGQRVELGEIETHLQAYLEQPGPVVTEVIVDQQQDRRPTLVAFVQTDDDRRDANTPPDFDPRILPIATQAKEEMLKRLPNYMVPTLLLSVNAFPVTATGKIDRNELRKIGAQFIAGSEQPMDLSLQTSTVTDCGTLIYESEQPAYALAQKVCSMLPACLQFGRRTEPIGDLKRGCLAFNNALLHATGLDSVNIMTLVHFISDNFQVRIGLDLLLDKSTTIRSLARLVSDGNTDTKSPKVDIIAEIARHDSRIAKHQQKILDSAEVGYCTNIETPLNLGSRITALLTGANGYVGTQILRQLLEHGRVGHVIALVRGESADDARRRTVEAARRALWWTDLHAEKLEVWCGDLSLPRLGLDQKNWTRLRDRTTVDVVVHNGAAVHFTKSYDALETINVGSTVELLLLTLTSPYARFVYVSSRQKFDTQVENDEDLAKKLSETGAIPYSQTKLVAETLQQRLSAQQ